MSIAGVQVYVQKFWNMLNWGSLQIVAAPAELFHTTYLHQDNSWNWLLIVWSARLSSRIHNIMVLIFVAPNLSIKEHETLHHAKFPIIIVSKGILSRVDGIHENTYSYALQCRHRNKLKERWGGHKYNCKWIFFLPCSPFVQTVPIFAPIKAVWIARQDYWL